MVRYEEGRNRRWGWRKGEERGEMGIMKDRRCSERGEVREKPKKGRAFISDAHDGG